MKANTIERGQWEGHDNFVRLTFVSAKAADLYAIEVSMNGLDFVIKTYLYTMLSAFRL